MILSAELLFVAGYAGVIGSLVLCLVACFGSGLSFAAAAAWACLVSLFLLGVALLGIAARGL